MKSDSPECKVVVHPAALRLMVNDSWNIAHATLWHNRPFASKEIRRAKRFIKRYYQQIPAAFFQQVAPVKFHHLCLCITEFSRDKDFDCSPSEWFNPTYKLGFYSWIMEDPTFESLRGIAGAF